MTSTPQPSDAALDELAAAEIDATDLETLHRMAELYDRSDPVPSGLVERIRFGITLDALHAEIAELQRSDELAGVRAESATEAHTVTFASTSLTTMITITALSSERVRIDGWVAPGAGVRVELRRPDGSLHAVADADGRFVFADVEKGLAQFVLRGDGQPVITPSIEF